jgi:selenocysteine lyase/cysteine desulfurase
VRAASHCAQHALAHFGLGATVRVSFGAYSTEDVAALMDALERGVRSG